MSVSSTVLFGRPQQEIASRISAKMSRSLSTSIVTGFATPAGVAMIAASLKTHPRRLQALVVGAATYKAFEAVDSLMSAGVSSSSLFVHLGHTYNTGTPKNPFARFHPMLHSKIYHMELPGDQACAFVGSHNLTEFALGGMNGEAAVMLEGPSSSPEFEKIRNHIAESKRQSVAYDPLLKEAYAWWFREFIDGLRVEIQLPQDWSTVRTILIFAEALPQHRMQLGERLYFEIPQGIEQIESLKTEVHLFLFDKLPATPGLALTNAAAATAKVKCRTLGADNQQGNLEVIAEWQIARAPRPVLTPVPTGRHRPTPTTGMQQVRARVETLNIEPHEYLFERERSGWDPEFAPDDRIRPGQATMELVRSADARQAEGLAREWSLVQGLSPRLGALNEKDQDALRLARPEAGAFILVSLRRRKTDRAWQNRDR